jgi:YHS domain-containing protein
LAKDKYRIVATVILNFYRGLVKMHNEQVVKPTGLKHLYLATIVFSLMSVFSLNASATHDVSVSYQGNVISGYDPVAYFTMGNAMRGSTDISTEYLGGTWLFVNEQHREMFLTDPGKYIPQYGGYCSVSSSFGRHGSANPESWQIVDNKLYLFYNKATSDGWDVGYSSTEAADKKWEKAKAGLLAQ